MNKPSVNYGFRKGSFADYSPRRHSIDRSLCNHVHRRQDQLITIYHC